MEDKYKTGTTLMIVGGALVAVAALLPWATVTAPFVGTVNVAGTSGDGVITLIGGMLIAVFGFLALSNRNHTLLWLGGVGGIAAVAIGGYDAQNVSDGIDAAVGDAGGLVAASVGIGLWLTIAAGVLVIIGVLMAISVHPAAVSQNASPPPTPPMPTADESSSEQ